MIVGLNSFYNDNTQVQVTEKNCIHVRVFRDLQGKSTLNYVIYGKTIEDPIEIM